MQIVLIFELNQPFEQVENQNFQRSKDMKCPTFTPPG